MEHNPGKNPVILEAAENCEQLFIQCYDESNKAVANQDRDGWPHLIANQQGRFRVWAENIGVYADENASLDYRLRDSPTVAKVMLGQLSTLDTHLQNIKVFLLDGDDRTQATDEIRTPESVVSDTSPDSESEESKPSIPDEPADIRAVRHAIDRLNRLSLTIRRQSVIQRNSRAAFYEEEDENRVEKVSAFNAMAQHMVNIWYPDASEIIQHRLAETMVIRRRQLLYRRSHQQKLRGQAGRQSRPNRNQLAPPTSTGMRHSPSSNYRNYSAPTQSLRSVSNSKAETQSKRSATHASTMYESRFYPDAASSKASTAVSAAASDFEFFELPKPPKPIQQGHTDFICPYCYMVVPLKEAEGKNWKYVSIFYLLHSMDLLNSVQTTSHERFGTLHLLIRKLYRTTTTISGQNFLAKSYAKSCCQMGLRPTNTQTADI